MNYSFTNKFHTKIKELAKISCGDQQEGDCEKCLILKPLSTSRRRWNGNYLVDGNNLAGVVKPIRLAPQNLNDAASLGSNDWLSLFLDRGNRCARGGGLLGPHHHPSGVAP